VAATRLISAAGTTSASPSAVVTSAQPVEVTV
jgi:hypothetical protein